MGDLEVRGDGRQGSQSGIGPGVASCLPSLPPSKEAQRLAGSPHIPPRKPGSLFLSLGPLFPQSQSRKAGSSWSGRVERLLKGPAAALAHLHLPGQTCYRARGDTGKWTDGTGRQMVQDPKAENPHFSTHRLDFSHGKPDYKPTILLRINLCRANDSTVGRVSDLYMADQI